MTNSEDKRQEDRREKDRRNQDRRKKDRRFAFYYKLINFLLGSLGLMIIAWAYIFWVYQLNNLSITFKLTETNGKYKRVCLSPKDILPDDLDDVILGKMIKEAGVFYDIELERAEQGLC